MKVLLLKKKKNCCTHSRKQQEEQLKEQREGASSIGTGASCSTQKCVAYFLPLAQNKFVVGGGGGPRRIFRGYFAEIVFALILLHIVFGFIDYALKIHFLIF